jgi:hypothetical protein
MRVDLAPLLDGQPSGAEVVARLQKLEGSSMGETRDRCEYLASLAVQLDTLPDDVTASLERQGADIPTSTSTFSAVLLAYSPSFSTAIKDAARAFLDGAKSSGYDRAETLLVECRIDEVVLMPESGASFGSRALSSANTVAGQAITPPRIA